MSASTWTAVGGEVVAATSCRWVSSWSRSSSAPGRSSATCRAISEPIEPPAPVMRTRRPRTARGLEVGLDLGAADRSTRFHVTDVLKLYPAANQVGETGDHPHDALCPFGERRHPPDQGGARRRHG